MVNQTIQLYCHHHWCRTKRLNTDKQLRSYADKLGTVINRASRHFIDGMRGFEYALAALAWFIHPFAFIAATLLVTRVIYRREFSSRTLQAMEEN